MLVLGIETSCDECAAAIVEDGEKILSNVVATQIPYHAEFSGVVPEVASRKHIEWIYAVVKEAIEKAGLTVNEIEGVAVTNRPGLFGSLAVGLNFAKAFAWARDLPFIAVDHMLAHLYAPKLKFFNHEPYEPTRTTDIFELKVRNVSVVRGKNNIDVDYPFLGLLVSGGHTIICKANDFDDIEVLGATIDDAAGEAFDKVAKFYGFGYPGGAVIDKMARNGDPGAFRFPLPSLHKGDHRYDVSYSGIKTAVTAQIEMFRVKEKTTNDDIAASFQKTAIDILMRALLNAAEDTGLATIVAGGGVAANSCLRARLAESAHLNCVFPPLDLCGDNGAMIAGIGYRYLKRGDRSGLDAGASARVQGFKKRYP